VIAGDRHDTPGRDPNRAEVLEEQIEQQLVPAWAAPILRITREKYAVELPIFARESLSQASEQQIQQFLARILLDTRYRYLVIVPRERRRVFGDVSVSNV
jgi:hypothetical protein